MFVHSSAVVDEGAVVGNGSKIWHFSHIMGSASIGEDCVIGQNCFIGENVVIGNNVKIQNNVSIFEGVEIEDNVFVGPSVVFTNVVKPRSAFSTNKTYQKTIVKKGSTIGANSTVICGNTVGQYSMVGAGSVVNKEVIQYSLVVGNPIRTIDWIGETGQSLKINGYEAVDVDNKKKYTVTYENNQIIKIEEL